MSFKDVIRKELEELKENVEKNCKYEFKTYPFSIPDFINVKIVIEDKDYKAEEILKYLKKVLKLNFLNVYKDKSEIYEDKYSFYIDLYIDIFKIDDAISMFEITQNTDFVYSYLKEPFNKKILLMVLLKTYLKEKTNLKKFYYFEN